MYNIPILTQCSNAVKCPDAMEIRNFFVSKGYKGIPISIVDSSITSLYEQNNRQLPLKNQFSSVKVEMMKGMVADLSLSLTQEMKMAESEGFKVGGFCTTNIDFCDPNISDLVRNEFKCNECISSQNYHIWENPDPKKADTLYTKYEYNMELLKKMDSNMLKNKK